MRARILLAVGALLVVVFVAIAPSTAIAVTYYQAGMHCLETGTANSDSRTSYGQLYNNSFLNGLQVACPVTQFESSTQDIEAFRLYYDEDNTGSDLEDQFYCRLNMSTDAGTTYNSGDLWTCNTAGGCGTADSDDNPGAGYLSFGNLFSSTAGVVYIGFACFLCEDSPGTCQINGYRVELAGS